MNERNRHHKAIVAKLSRIGSALEVKMVAVGLSEADAFTLEIERISFWREAGVDLTNMTNGGEGVSGLRHTEETKKLWSDQRKGMRVTDDGRAKRSASLKGRPKTKEHAAAAGKAGGLARTGKKQNADWIAKRVKTMKENNSFIHPHRCKAVVCVTYETEFPSVSEAARCYNLQKNYVSSVCRGKRTNTKGLVFKFKEPA
jgi:NADPH-dependent glutamate synthase beta subunit-like oxidoreductase